MYVFFSFQSIDNRKVKLGQNFLFQDYITVILFFLEGYPVVTQVHLNKRVYMYKPILHGLISFCNNAQIDIPAIHVIKTSITKVFSIWHVVPSWCVTRTRASSTVRKIMKSKDKTTKQNIHVHVLLYEFYK